MTLLRWLLVELARLAGWQPYTDEDYEKTIRAMTDHPAWLQEFEVDDGH